jgi:uncharacterized protein (DUF983 family)
MTALIILNLTLAFVGAFLNRLRTLFAGPDSSDLNAAIGALIGTAMINMILWLGFTTNASLFLVLTVTWPSLPLGVVFGLLWHRWAKKGSKS